MDDGAVFFVFFFFEVFFFLNALGIYRKGLEYIIIKNFHFLMRVGLADAFLRC